MDLDGEQIPAHGCVRERDDGVSIEVDGGPAEERGGEVLWCASNHEGKLRQDFLQVPQGVWYHLLQEHNVCLLTVQKGKETNNTLKD